MLSIDQVNIARSCDQELLKATELTGAFDRMDKEQLENAKRRIKAIAEDMAESLPYAINHKKIPELFRIARMYYARVPCLLDLQKAWDNHMKPRIEAPTPDERPRLEPPQIGHSEAQMRHLAAVRTSLATSGHMRIMASRCVEMKVEEWMKPLLEQDPSRKEVEAMYRACTPSSLAFYARRPDAYPNWGEWFVTFGMVKEE